MGSDRSYAPLMAMPSPERPSVTPGCDPRVIRRALTPILAAEFDREWDLVVERTRKSMDLDEIYALLDKWAHTAHLEQAEPGAYRHLLDKAEDIRARGGNPRAADAEEMHSMIGRRLGR